MGLSPRSKRQCFLTCHLFSYCKSISTAYHSSEDFMGLPYLVEKASSREKNTKLILNVISNSGLNM